MDWHHYLVTAGIYILSRVPKETLMSKVVIPTGSRTVFCTYESFHPQLDIRELWDGISNSLRTAASGTEPLVFDEDCPSQV